MLQINYYAMQNVEANFPQPARFMPERWLGHPRAAAGASSGDASADGSVETDPLARAFLPYSAGPRSCIGQPLAQMEVLCCHFALAQRGSFLSSSASIMATCVVDVEVM